MANFDFYLNRTGPRGPQGEQGEQGFSPIITVATDTLSEYILQIQTQNNTFQTANLREHKDDLGGTYIRYNRETGVMYAGEADVASQSQMGVVRFATVTDIERQSNDCVVSPADVQDMISDIDPSGDISALTQRVSMLESTTSSNTQAISANTAAITNNTNDITANSNSISSLQDTVLALSQNKADRTDIPTVGNGIITINQGSVQKGQFSLNQAGDLTINLEQGGGGSTYTEGPGIDIDNNVISIDSAVVALKSDLPNMNNYYNTTQIDLMLQDKADISEVPTKTSELTNDSQFITSSDLPTVGNGTITFTQGGVTKGTITTNQSGNTTIDFDAGGGSTPTNMVTTDTVQTITAAKTFGGNTALYGTRFFLPDDKTEMYVGSSGKTLYLQGSVKGNYQNNAFGNVVFSNNISDYLPAATTSTLGGVKVDGTTITIDANGVISSSGGSTPSNMVTTNTTQTISGQKTFSDNIYIGGNKGLVDSYTGTRIAGTDTNYNINLGNSTRNTYINGNVITVFSDSDIRIQRNRVLYTNIDSGNIGTYALTGSNISTNAYVQSLEARIAALEANINGGSAASA